MNKDFSKLSNTEDSTRLISTLTELFVVDIKTYSIRLKLALLFGYIRVSAVFCESKIKDKKIKFTQEQIEQTVIDVAEEMIRDYKRLVTSVKFEAVELDNCAELSKATHEFIKQELEAQFVG
mgnify:CR=1 FL=1